MPDKILNIHSLVIPAKAGIYSELGRDSLRLGGFVGMTEKGKNALKGIFSLI